MGLGGLGRSLRACPPPPKLSPQLLWPCLQIFNHQSSTGSKSVSSHHYGCRSGCVGEKRTYRFKFRFGKRLLSEGGWRCLSFGLTSNPSASKLSTRKLREPFSQQCWCVGETLDMVRSQNARLYLISIHVSNLSSLNLHENSYLWKCSFVPHRNLGKAAFYPWKTYRRRSVPTLSLKRL